MVPKGNYSWRDVVKRAAENGRHLGRTKISAIARTHFGDVNNLTAEQIDYLLDKIDLTKSPLTKEKTRQIRSLLYANQSLPPVKRLTNSQIANEVSHSLAPISSGTVDRISSGVTREIRAAGLRKKGASNTAKYDDPVVIKNLRETILQDLSITFADAAKRVGVPSSMVELILKRNGTNFKKFRSGLYGISIHRLDEETGGRLFDREVAKRLGIKEGTVRLYRNRTNARKKAAEARIALVKQSVLSWLGALTSPESSSISIDGIKSLVGRDFASLGSAMKDLEKSKFIQTVYHQKRKLFRITARGMIEVSKTRTASSGRIHYIENIGIDELKIIHERLIAARYKAGVGIPSSVIKVIENLITQKSATNKNI